MASKFDRSAEDVGNILALEHLNLTVPEPRDCARFYVSGLGFTRDPYMDFGVLNFNNMWVNVRRPTIPFAGREAAAVPRTTSVSTCRDLDQLRWRLEHVGKSLKDTRSAGRSTTITSTSRAHGAIAALPRAGSSRWRSASAISTWRYRREPRRGSRGFISRFSRRRRTDANGLPQVQLGTNQTLRFIETENEISTPTTATTSQSMSQTSPRRTTGSRTRPRHRGDRSASISLPGNRRSGRTNAAPCSRTRARGTQPEAPNVGRHLVNRNSGQTFLTFHRGREAFVP